jgi:hypothetical protein
MPRQGLLLYRFITATYKYLLKIPVQKRTVHVQQRTLLLILERIVKPDKFKTPWP